MHSNHSFFSILVLFFRNSPALPSPSLSLVSYLLMYPFPLLNYSFFLLLFFIPILCPDLAQRLKALWKGDTCKWGREQWDDLALEVQTELNLLLWRRRRKRETFSLYLFEVEVKVALNCSSHEYDCLKQIQPAVITSFRREYRACEVSAQRKQFNQTQLVLPLKKNSHNIYMQIITSFTVPMLFWTLFMFQIFSDIVHMWTFHMQSMWVYFFNLLLFEQLLFT